jgi:hypothetical protein
LISEKVKEDKSFTKEFYMGKDPSKPFEYDQELNLPHLNYDVARSHSNEYFIFAPNSKMGSQ